MGEGAANLKELCYGLCGYSDVGQQVGNVPCGFLAPGCQTIDALDGPGVHQRPLDEPPGVELAEGIIQGSSAFEQALHLRVSRLLLLVQV